MALRYIEGGEGVIYTEDGGATWRALPSSAIQPQDGEAPIRLGRIAIGGDGNLYMTTVTSLLKDETMGCQWSVEPGFADEWLTDLAHDPTDPGLLYALRSSADGSENGPYRHEADGTWQLVGQGDDLLLARLQVAELASGGLRFYASGSRGILGEAPVTRPNYVLRWSEDEGTTWTEYALEDALGELDAKVALEAVDPTNPDRILLSLVHEREGRPPGSIPPDAVLVSSDAGATYTEYLSLTQFGGLAVAPDGRVWIGDLGDSFVPDAAAGLYSAASLDEAPANVADSYQISCITYLPDTDRLFVCQRDQAGFIGTDGSGYEKSFDFREVEEFVSCEGLDMVETCRRQLLGAWCGASHFPQAPMCCPYPDRVSMDANLLPGETPQIELNCPDAGMPMGGAGGMAGTVTGGAGAAGTAGGTAGGVAAAGGSAGTTAGEAGAIAGNGGSDEAGDDGGSGCGCSVPGSEQHTPTGPGLLALVAAAGLELTVRRRRG